MHLRLSGSAHKLACHMHPRVLVAPYEPFATSRGVVLGFLFNNSFANVVLASVITQQRPCKVT